MTRIYAALESVLFGVAFFVKGGVTHLTWWNVVLLVACNVVYVWDPTSTLYVRVWQAFATLATLVQLTVVIMSLLGCSMIREALIEVGPWLYYFGNFALHYWPTIRAAALRPPAFSQLYYDAARIMAVYATLHRPEKVYSCDKVSPYLVMPLGIAVVIGIEWFISKVANAKITSFKFTYGTYFTQNQQVQ